jgi:hypothetical protein
MSHPDLVAEIERIIGAGDNRTNRAEVPFLCPAHDDTNPSAHWNRSKRVWKCRVCDASGGYVDLAKRLGIEVKDKRASGSRSNSRTGVTLAQFAEAKAVRFRMALHKDGKADNRFEWRPGSKVQLYGTERIRTLQPGDRVLLVEGESDTVTAWHHGIAAVGVPGASNWSDSRDAVHLEHFEVYVIVEPDRGGECLSSTMKTSRIARSVHLVTLPDGIKDLSALHIDDPERFRERLEAAMADAVHVADLLDAERLELAREAQVAAGDLLDEEDIIGRVRETIAARGYAGDTRPPAIAYVAMVSRLLQRPINIALIAPSAAGKNEAVRAAQALTPPEALYTMSAGSARALIYDDDDFTNRTVVIEEADAIPDEGPVASAVRAIAETGALTYNVVERDPESSRFYTRHITKPGPTGLITTSTKSLAYQLGTRVIEVPIADDNEQTREVMRIHARRAAGMLAQVPDPEPFIALQRWIELVGEHRVEVPFAPALIELLPVHLVRFRRDAAQLLECVKAIALLHQRHRERSPSGAIVADLADYAIARDLLLPVFDTIATEGVTPAIREVVEVVEPGEEVSQAEIGDRLQLSKSTTSYRVGKALRGGWLVNKADTGKPKKLVLGSSLPELKPALPDVCEVQQGFKGGSTTHLNPHEAVFEFNEGPETARVQGFNSFQGEREEVYVADEPGDEWEEIAV